MLVWGEDVILEVQLLQRAHITQHRARTAAAQGVCSSDWIRVMDLYLFPVNLMAQLHCFGSSRGYSFYSHKLMYACMCTHRFFSSAPLTLPMQKKVRQMGYSPVSPAWGKGLKDPSQQWRPQRRGVLQWFKHAWSWLFAGRSKAEPRPLVWAHSTLSIDRCKYGLVHRQ